MTCEQTERVLMEDAQSMAPSAHAASCATCSEALSAVRSAREVLRSHDIEVPQGSKRRAWQAMEKKQRRKEIVLPILAFSASFAAVGAFYLLAPTTTSSPDHLAVEPSNPQLAQTKLVEKKRPLAQREKALELTEPRLSVEETEVGVERNASSEAVQRNAKLKRIAAKAKPVLKINTDLQATLEAAKDALPSNAPRAKELAEKVLISAEKTTILEAEALAVLADAERRQQRYAEAAALYARVADHPAGAPFAEEALLQRALILAQLDNKIEAIAVLELAEKRFAAGPTAPERAALLADMLLRSGNVEAAAGAIERSSQVGRSMKLLTRRLEVARALIGTEPERARALLEPLLNERTPAALRAEAEALRKK